MWAFIRKPRNWVLLLVMSPFVILISPVILQFLYTPPALTSKALAAYCNCIDFMRQHDQYKNLRFHTGGSINLKDDTFILRTSPSNDRERIKKYFSPDEIQEIETIWTQLSNAKCLIAARKGDVVLFYPFRQFFLPKRPGVLYSLSSKNPNNSNSDSISRYGPFINISGSWYMSRALRLPLRSNASYDAAPLPKSLIDRSLDAEAIEKEKLMDK